MRAVVMRVSEASVEIGGEIVGQIARGLLVLLGVGHGDSLEDADRLADKVANLRIFPDERKPQNRSVLDEGGDVLAVSQFTLLADTSRGRRPSYVGAAPPEVAEPLYERFVAALEGHGIRVARGRFGAAMRVASVNDGPVTVLLTTKPEDAL